MAETSSIEWTDSTFNPWIGCTRVSPACDNCYAAVSTPSRRFGVEWGAGNARRRTSGANWKLPLRWNRADEAKLAAWEHFKAQYPGLTESELEGRGFIKPRRRRVFCASLADVFDNEVDPQWRTDLWELIARTPNLDWLLLTKRIGNVERMLPVMDSKLPGYRPWNHRWPWPNVWLGATICNQAEADRDIPKLLRIPARVRFLSMEPLLGPVDLNYAFGIPTGAGHGSCPMHLAGVAPEGLLPTGKQHLHWVIVGGESGHKARPMHPDWVRSLRDQCAAARVPFLFKQWGEWGPYNRGATDSRILASPGSLDHPMQPFGKKLAGRVLDGVVHDGFPGGRE